MSVRLPMYTKTFIESTYMRKISIIDCHIGNRAAIRNMLRVLGEDPLITNCPVYIGNSDILILPGIGSFDSFMEALDHLGLTELIKTTALDPKKTILGICIGMQALFSNSEEGIKSGLGLIPGTVQSLKSVFEDNSKVKIPHIGWEGVFPAEKGLADNQARYYFTHSYHCVPEENAAIYSYFQMENKKFVAGIKQNKVWGVQFHPEKSHQYGLNFFKEFLDNA